MEVRVAVDAMGGDRAPGEVIAGAREARSDDVVPVLFGPRDVIAPLAPDLEIVDAPQFYYAEDYHQQYLAKNPKGYCGLGGCGVSFPLAELDERA